MPGCLLGLAPWQFGSGPRGCIGKNISILEMWKVVFELYRHFEINVVGDGEWVVNGMWFTTQSNVDVQFKPRSRVYKGSENDLST